MPCRLLIAPAVLDFVVLLAAMLRQATAVAAGETDCNYTAVGIQQLAG